jgi:hypothetical protein
MSKVHRTVQAILGIWIVVAVVMLVRLHSVDLSGLAPSGDYGAAAQNYKNRMDETRVLLSTGELPTH